MHNDGGLEIQYISPTEIKIIWTQPTQFYKTNKSWSSNYNYGPLTLQKDSSPQSYSSDYVIPNTFNFSNQTKYSIAAIIFTSDGMIAIDLQDSSWEDGTKGFSYETWTTDLPYDDSTSPFTWTGAILSTPSKWSNGLQFHNNTYNTINKPVYTNVLDNSVIKYVSTTDANDVTFNVDNNTNFTLTLTKSSNTFSSNIDLLWSNKLHSMYIWTSESRSIVDGKVPFYLRKKNANKDLTSANYFGTTNWNAIKDSYSGTDTYIYS